MGSRAGEGLARRRRYVDRCRRSTTTAQIAIAQNVPLKIVMEDARSGSRFSNSRTIGIVTAIDISMSADELSQTRLRINEIFFSIQGEST